jgi:tetratricopeptide (TPR) repeat protein
MKRLLTQLILLIAIAITSHANSAPKEGSEEQQLINEVQTVFNEGKYQDAYAKLEEYLKKQPHSIIVGNYYRTIIRERNYQDRAIRFFKNIIGPEEFEKDKPLVERKSTRLVENGTRYNLAFAFIDKIPLVGPMGAGFLSKKSIAQFRKVLNREPDNWIANYGVGMNYLHWPDYFEKNDDSISYFQKCIALQKNRERKPSHLLPYIRLGDALVKLNKVKDARAIWEEGLIYFPKHPDLETRLALNDKKISKAILDLYNPDNSIGEIDTNIEILWAEQLPEQLIPLFTAASNKNKGIGGHFKLKKTSDSNIKLLTWFTKNLPFLMNKDSLAYVDMSELGAVNKTNTTLSNLIAHNMISGFMTFFKDTPIQETKALINELDPYERPFFQEGIGMAIGASIDISVDQNFSLLQKNSNQLGNEFRRLHYAGAGMWHGLNPTVQVEKVLSVLQDLNPFESSYFSEGFGFSIGLFHYGRNPEILQIGNDFPPLLASSFFHGVGRAFWILGGQNTEFFKEALDHIPDIRKADSYSGFGMGVAFTRANVPSEVFQIANWEELGSVKKDFLTGVIMGYSIRFLADKNYINSLIRNFEDNERDILVEFLDIGLEALSEADTGIGDFHQNWRALIRDALDEELISLTELD